MATNGMSQLADATKFKREMWGNLGEKLVKSLFDRTFEKGKNVKDKKFKAYSTKQKAGYNYKDYKARGMKTISTGKKLAAYKGRSTNRETGFVNLTLTNKFQRDLRRRRTTKNSVEYGWNKEGEKVEFALSQGRDILGSLGISKKEGEIIEDTLGDFIEKKIVKWANKSVTVRVG